MMANTKNLIVCANRLRLAWLRSVLPRHTHWNAPPKLIADLKLAEREGGLSLNFDSKYFTRTVKRAQARREMALSE